MSDLGNTNALQKIKPYLLVLDFSPFLESKGVVNTWVLANGHPNTKSANTNESILSFF